MWGTEFLACGARAERNRQRTLFQTSIVRFVSLAFAFGLSACDTEDLRDLDDLEGDGLTVEVGAYDGKTDKIQNYKMILSPDETKSFDGTQQVGQFEATVVSESYDGGKDWLQIDGPAWLVPADHNKVELRIDQIGSTWWVDDDTTSDLAFVLFYRPIGKSGAWTKIEVEPDYDQLVSGTQALSVSTFTRATIAPREGRLAVTALFEAGEADFDVQYDAISRGRLEYLVVPVPISTIWGTDLEGTWQYKMQASCDGKPCDE